MITGIEDISRTKQKAVLEFISSEFDLDEAIKVAEEDDDIITINGNRYFMIRPYEEEELMDDLNDNRFDAAFENLSDEQRHYVDKDSWIEDKGIHDFIDYLKYELDEMPSEDYVVAGGFHFYEL
jgi:hypothetical protein